MMANSSSCKKFPLENSDNCLDLLQIEHVKQPAICKKIAAWSRRLHHFLVLGRQFITWYIPETLKRNTRLKVNTRDAHWPRLVLDCCHKTIPTGNTCQTDLWQLCFTCKIEHPAHSLASRSQTHKTPDWAILRNLWLCCWIMGYYPAILWAWCV